MRRYGIFYPVLALATAAAVACGPRYDVEGEVLQDRLWEAGNFGHVYALQIQTNQGIRDFLFVGDEPGLQKLDDRLNRGDKVGIRESTAFAPDGLGGLVMVLTDEHVDNIQE